MQEVNREQRAGKSAPKTCNPYMGLLKRVPVTTVFLSGDKRFNTRIASGSRAVTVIQSFLLCSLRSAEQSSRISLVRITAMLRSGTIIDAKVLAALCIMFLTSEES